MMVAPWKPVAESKPSASENTDAIVGGFVMLAGCGGLCLLACMVISAAAGTFWLCRAVFGGTP